MERRETYDPEDIESLLNERSFDELLAEERAFVLRHINGREEYEAMRTLLQRVKREEGEAAQESFSADPAIREHLMQVYRDRQVPAWRIWLNTVQAFLFPQHASAFWRPALALASIALLVTFGVIGYQRMTSGASDQLAVVKENKAEEGVHAFPPTADQPLATEPLAGAALEEEKDLVSNGTGTYTREEALAATGTLDATAEDRSQDVKLGYTFDVTGEKQPAAVADHPFRSLLEASDSTSTALLAAPAVNYVERAELLANDSYTNAAGNVAMAELAQVEIAAKDVRPGKMKALEKSLDADSRSLAQDDRVLELLNAAW